MSKIVYTLKISGFGLLGSSTWFLALKSPYNNLVNFSPEIAFLTIPSAILCLPSFWIVLSIHNHPKSFKYLSLVSILLIFAIVLLIIGIYIGSTHKFHIEHKQLQGNAHVFDEFRAKMASSMLQHFANWQQVQANFKCCGTNNYSDWLSKINYIPQSCCQQALCRSNYFSTGCLKVILADLALHTCIFNGLNCVVFVIQCCAFVGVVLVYFCGNKCKQEK